MENDANVKAAAKRLRQKLDEGATDGEAFAAALKVYLEAADCGLVANSALKNHR